MYLTLFHVVCHDICFYAVHWGLHSPAMYWMHKQHHKTHHTDLRYWHTNEGHLIENIIQPLGIFIPFLWSWSPLSFIAASGIVGLRGLIRHDNRLTWLFGKHHISHHRYGNCNYGEYWIDYLCGTLRQDADASFVSEACDPPSS